MEAVEGMKTIPVDEAKDAELPPPPPKAAKSKSKSKPRTSAMEPIDLDP